MRILVTFHDDSTLLWAAKFQRSLGAHLGEVAIREEVTSRSHVGVSERQRTVSGARIDDEPLLADELADQIAAYDVVVSCKPSAELGALVRNPDSMQHRARPRFVAFHPGLSLTPMKGIANRDGFDAIVCNAHHEVALVNATTSKTRHVDWYQPSLRPRRSWCGSTADDIERLVFFTQAESPSTLTSRSFLAEFLSAFAVAHPDLHTVVKLRSLPNENAGHVHQERFHYPDLVRSAPDNLVVSTASAETYLTPDSLVLGCTTTVLVESACDGVPTMSYLDYPEASRDRLNLPMRALLRRSGIIATLDEIWGRNVRPPNGDWLAANARTDPFEAFFTRLVDRLD